MHGICGQFGRCWRSAHILPERRASLQDTGNGRWANNDSPIATVVLLVVYLAVGAAFYSRVEGWDAVDSLYFAMVTMSTVGYGDMSPTTEGSRFFTSLYILSGVIVVFARLANALAGILSAIDGRVLQVLHRVQGKGLGFRPQVAATDTGHSVEPVPNAYLFWTQGLACSMLVLIAFQALATGLFMACEPDMSLELALWHVLVTATTVGYGDVKLTTWGSKLWGFVHILISVAWVAAVISRVFELRAKRKTQFQRHDLLVKQLDEDVLLSLDRDGQGVDKTEFVVGILIAMGAELCGSKLTWEDVHPFIQQFEAMDIDKTDGKERLTKADLRKVAQRNKEVAMHQLADGAVAVPQRTFSKVLPSPDGAVSSGEAAQNMSICVMMTR